MRIETRDAQGKPNGWLLTLWHLDQGPRVDQVYLTAISPWCSKGPHLHKVRRGLFTCLRGNVLLVWRKDGEYHEVEMGEGSRFEVEPGVPVAFYNLDSEEAWLLNMPSPPWRADEPDEHPVEDWSYECQMQPS